MSIFDIHKVRNHPDWSTFDRSKRSHFTAKLGMLLPVRFETVMPGDHVEFNLNHQTQTAEFQQNAFAAIKEHFDVFFVPFRLLYDKANEILVENNQPLTADATTANNNLVAQKLPHFNVATLQAAIDELNGTKDILGFDRGFNATRLAQQLGYGKHKANDSVSNWSMNRLSLMPFAAYQKIYADFYRYQQWEKLDPYTYNFNYVGSSNTPLTVDQVLGKPQHSSQTSEYGMSLLDMRYVNYYKDYLFGVLPSQVNDVYLPETTAMFDTPSLSSIAANQHVGVNTRSDGKTGKWLGTPYSTVDVNLENFRTNISVLQIRAAFALQKWSEVQLFADNNYKDKVKHHFNVDVPDYTAHLAQYLGGSTSVININDIVNNNLADGADPTRKAIGNNASTCHVSFDAKEHGIVMAIYHASPLINYDSSIVYDPQVLAVDVDDFPKPEFDRLGLEPVRESVFHNDYRDRVLGYAPRYWQWKSVIDTYFGDFTDTRKGFILSPDMSYWESVSEDDKLYYDYFKVSPSDVDQLFLPSADDSYSTDVFLVKFGIQCSIKRPLNYSGMPY